MSVLSAENSVLLIIDIQKKLINAAFNKAKIEKNSEIISKASDIIGIPCIITEQYPKGLGETILQIKENVKGQCFEKITFNALDCPEMYNYLKSLSRKQIILAGIETHICVRQTAAALLNAGFEVSIIKDCCGSRFEDEHISGLDVMKQEGCYIKTTEMVLFELLKSAKHPNFKEIQALIK